MTRKKLPIGIQSFAKIRQEGYYYVDKTPFVARLAEEGSYYFLSRPRRFGKSLFVDTLAEAFSGNRGLFTGLYLEDHWDWSRRHPVIRISFAEGRLQSRQELDQRIGELLERNQRMLNVRCTLPSISGCFGELIELAHKKYDQRAVILVDEYDKPILDNLTEPEIARQMREGLRNLYSVIKGQDAHIRFAFLTGVSKFSKVSLFSGLNNLRDITLSEKYATICGYTDEDVDTVFAPELSGLDREAIRQWYNGYRWGETPVSNPFDLLLLFEERQFRSWWFETATPTFLVDWLLRHGFFTPRLERLYASEALLSAFDVDRMEPEALLWQTGYLTISEVLESEEGIEYVLGLPNREVRKSLNEALARAFVPVSPTWSAHAIASMLKRGDVPGLRDHMVRLFASIPHSWYDTSPIARYEGYYASVFYSHLASLGLTIIPEDISNVGRCDLIVRHGQTVWVMEFKVVDGEAPTGEALAHLQQKNYAAKYQAPGVTVLQVGIEFSRTKRQIVGWEGG
jgi:hypothetical protein